MATETETKPKAETEPEPAEPSAPTPEPEPEPEEEEAEQGEQAPSEPATPPVDAAKEMARLEKGVQRERELHAKRLGQILGEADQDTLPCPLCFEGLMGFVFPGQAAELSDEQRNAAAAFLGMVGDRRLNMAEGVSECDRCDGWGQLSFPTKVPHVAEQTCPKCSGSGYTVEGQQQPAPLALAPSVPAQATDNGQSVGACTLCGAPNSAGVPHWCNPPAAAGT